MQNYMPCKCSPTKSLKESTSTPTSNMACMKVTISYSISLKCVVYFTRIIFYCKHYAQIKFKLN